MFSGSTKNIEIVKQMEEAAASTPHQLDLIMEKYVVLTNQLKQDVRSLKEEIAFYKKQHGEISDSLDEFLTIQKASEIITQHLEFEKIVESLLELCARILEFTSADIYLFTDSQWHPLLKSNPDNFNPIVRNLTDEGIVDWMWMQHHPIVIPVSELIYNEQLSLQNGNLVITPLIVNHEGLGIFILHTEKDQAQFSFSDLELIHILGQQAATAIQYTRLYKNLEQTHCELKNSQAHLLQTIKLATVGELAGGIAHEINNPLQIIMGKIQIAMLQQTDPEVLKVVEMQAIRIATIVRGLLSLAREGKQSNKEYIDINAVVKQTVHLVRGQIEKRGINMEINLQANIPVFIGCSVSVQQVLLNFLLNAKKQMNKGGLLKIATRQETDNWIVVEFTDNGEPLEETIIKESLNPFSDVSIDKKNMHNLGLTVSVIMIREIGGDVRIESSKETGNRITIKIPKKYEEELTNDALLFTSA